VLVIVACGGGSKLAINIIDDTKAQIVAAEQAGAQETAVNELRDAANLLAEAEAVLTQGDDEGAYRIGKKAHLTARYAAALAMMKNSEVNANLAEVELEEAQKSEEKARKDREQAENELSALESR